MTGNPPSVGCYEIMLTHHLSTSLPVTFIYVCLGMAGSVGATLLAQSRAWRHFEPVDVTLRLFAAELDETAISPAVMEAANKGSAGAIAG